MSDTEDPDLTDADDNDRTKAEAHDRTPGRPSTGAVGSVTPDPPEPDGLPVLGHTISYLRAPFGLGEQCRDLGAVARVQVGPYDAVVVTDPDLVQRILVSDHGQYVKGSFPKRQFESLLGDGVLISDGDTWREARDALQPAFFREKITSYAPAMRAAAEATVAGFEDGAVVDAQDAMSATTMAALTRALFDESGDAATERVGGAMDDIMGRFSPGFGAFVPEWVPIPRNRRYRRAVADLDAFIDDLVAERGANPAGDDLLSTLLRAGFDDEFVRDQLMTLLLAGHETTALALTYALHLVGTHPDVERRLQREVDAVVGRDGSVGPEDVDDLAYTRQVVDEAMRLYPPVYNLFREPTETVTLGEYRVPAGTLISIPIWAIQRDSRWFDDPETFDPERWEREGERRNERPRFAFFPFGGGPRACIGEAFARLEATLVLATLAGSVTLEPLREDVEFAPAITTQPAHPMEMRVRFRE